LYVASKTNKIKAIDHQMSLLGLPQSFQPSGDELQSNVPLCIKSSMVFV
jgi:hypothetical protein